MNHARFAALVAGSWLVVLLLAFLVGVAFSASGTVDCGDVGGTVLLSNNGVSPRAISFNTEGPITLQAGQTLVFPCTGEQTWSDGTEDPWSFGFVVFQQTTAFIESFWFAGAGVVGGAFIAWALMRAAS